MNAIVAGAHYETQALAAAARTSRRQSREFPL